MKLSSLYAGSLKVFWRVFDQSEVNHDRGIAQGIFESQDFYDNGIIVGQTNGFDYRGQDLSFQLELRKDDRGGDLILQPIQSSLFQINRHYVLRANGVVDAFREPRLTVTAPIINAELSKSWQFKEDQLEAELDLKDWSIFRLDYKIDQLQVYFYYV